MYVGASGCRALWLRWDLVDRLAGERDAYRIPEIQAFASSMGTMDRRRAYAALIRRRLTDPVVDSEGRSASIAARLAELASELEDSDLVLDAACAVACKRLLTDITTSPLLNEGLLADELPSKVSQIRSGFTPRREGSEASTPFDLRPVDHPGVLKGI